MSNTIDYIEAGADAERKLLEIVKDVDGWKEINKSDGITIYSKKSKEFAGNMYKSEVVLDCNRDVAFHTWLPSPRGVRLEWDDLLKFNAVIKEFSEDTVIIRSVSKSYAKGLISSREFCDIVKISYYPDTETKSAACYSVEFPDCPIQSKYVRGKNYPSGIFFKAVPSDQNKCEVTYIIHSDIGGMLPRPLVESAIPGNTMQTLKTLKAAVADKRS